MPDSPRGTPASIIIADDHPVFRGGLCHLVGAAFPGTALYEAGSVEEMLAVAERYGAPWLFIVDLLFPGMDPKQTLPMLRQRFPRSAIAIVSMLDDDGTIGRVMDYGADAYIAKSVAADQMVEGLLALQRGDVVVLKPPGQSVQAASSARPESLALTQRQVDVLTMVAERKSNKEIGRGLSLSHFTVRNHVSLLLRTLGARTRTELADKARMAGIVAPGQGL
jgi:DNA-binding NarL/FixJ family response regulator